MDELEIRFSGSGGQGLILSARFLAAALVAEGWDVSQSQSYEPVSRGGLSRSDLVVRRGGTGFPLSQGLDYLLILDGAAAQASNDLLGRDSLVLVDSELVDTPPRGDFELLALLFIATARDIGNKRVANIVALAALVAKTGICARDTLAEVVSARTPAQIRQPQPRGVRGRHGAGLGLIAWLRRLRRLRPASAHGRETAP